MVGYSNDETPTPFILLANGEPFVYVLSSYAAQSVVSVQTRLPQALLLDALKNANLARCAQVLLQFVSLSRVCMYIDADISRSTEIPWYASPLDPISIN